MKVALMLLLSSFYGINSSLAYNIDQSKISVSGISSGSYMAGQLHVALSGTFSGVGLVAGGPYYCSQGSVLTALTGCMNISRPVDVNPAVDLVKQLSESGDIDNYENLKNDRVFALSGTYDRTVSRDAVLSAVDFYKALELPNESFHVETELPAGHTFPTENYGNDCSTASQSPYISKCEYDGAGMILKHIYGELNAKTTAVESHFLLMSQNRRGADEINPSSISMDSEALVYVPERCKQGHSCKLHVALHGCQQYKQKIGDQFIRNAGYNEWAEANDMIVLYPQTISQTINNPNGCWDWWGYTDAKFHTQSGSQIQVIKSMIDQLSRPEMTLSSHQ
tara:strand:+ start:29383 stop:30393 length:1011 start_codon:yes stop_codon:yes gene_type:complete